MLRYLILVVLYIRSIFTCTSLHTVNCEVVVSWLPFRVHYDGGVSIRLVELNVVAPKVRQSDSPAVEWVGCLEGWGKGGGAVRSVCFV